MIERVLEANSAELPLCRCGAEMSLTRIDARTADTALKIFHCPRCEHEMRLMVWSEPEAAV